MNKRLRSLHSWLGIVSGAFLLVIGMAGAMLVFTDDIDRALNPATDVVRRPAPRIPLNDLLADVRTAYPQASLTGVRLQPERPEAACTIAMNMRGSLWLVEMDPYSGAILSTRNLDHSFMRQVLALHRSFFFRPWGEAAVGLLAILFFTSALTGLILHRHSLARIFTVVSRWRSGTKARLFDLHTTVGTLACLFQLTMSATGFYMISPVYKRIVTGAGQGTAWMPLPRPSLDSLLTVAAQALPGFQPRLISLPNMPGKPIRVTGSVDGTCIMYGTAGSAVTFNPASGAMIQALDISKAPFADRLEQVVRSVHFGQYGSLPVRIIYSLGGLTPGVLSITGAIMWLRKRRRKNYER
ncbi:MAG TPA: PepSY-associated TM helix domain-containing protein [Candidatus Kapabacteria bacterium]|nr:PepSY-associated TM helix domain-containing protein [Candidatus Kapabacteria bacterium]